MMGMRKHRTSGHEVSGKCFTGRKGGKKVRRKSHKPKGKHVHENKYADSCNGERT